MPPKSTKQSVPKATKKATPKTTTTKAPKATAPPKKGASKRKEPTKTPTPSSGSEDDSLDGSSSPFLHSPSDKQDRILKTPPHEEEEDEDEDRQGGEEEEDQEEEHHQGQEEPFPPHQIETQFEQWDYMSTPNICNRNGEFFLCLPLSLPIIPSCQERKVLPSSMKARYSSAMTPRRIKSLTIINVSLSVSAKRAYLPLASELLRL